MPKLTLDASDVQDFAAIPEGRYEAKIAEIEAMKEGPKAPYLPIVFEVTGGEYAGKKIWRNYTMSGPGLGFFVRDVNRILGDEVLVAGELQEFDTDDLLGAECEIVVEVGEYQGEDTNDITKVLSA